MRKYIILPHLFGVDTKLCYTIFHLDMPRLRAMQARLQYVRAFQKYKD